MPNMTALGMAKANAVNVESCLGEKFFGFNMG
jgi:hypothetical protein